MYTTDAAVALMLIIQSFVVLTAFFFIAMLVKWMVLMGPKIMDPKGW